MIKPIHQARLRRLSRVLAREGIDAALLSPAPDFLYLTGILVAARARPIFLVVTPRRTALLCPLLEVESNGRALRGIPMWAWADGTDPFALLRDKLGKGRTFAVSRAMRADWVLKVQGSKPAPKVVSAAAILDELRSQKEPGELKALLASALLADTVMGEARARLKAGVREVAVAEYVLRRFLKAGAVNPWVHVASSANGAMPHYHYGERKLRRGDVVIVDLGAELAEYHSDITRTFFLGRPEPEAERVYATVLAAQSAGRARVKVGVTGEAADAAARGVITKAGYGKFFIHRLGHGLGLEIHEEPQLTSANRDPLPEGAVVTVEPGIYIPDRFGVRLEDVVVARKAGPRTLTTYPLDRQHLA